MPAFSPSALKTLSQFSPYGSLKPMKPTDLDAVLRHVLDQRRGDQIVVLRRLEHPALFRVERLDDADVPTVAIIGTLASAITSRIANALGVVDGPISASMLFSWISFLTFCTARVVSPPSSSEMYSIVAPPIVRGRMSPVFFCGMPIADVGPGGGNHQADPDLRIGGRDRQSQ